MRSYLLIYFRRVFNCDRNQIAAILDTSVEHYKRLESGRALLTREQALRLGKRFSAPPEIFLHESRQLNAAYTKKEEIIFYKSHFREVEKEQPESSLYEDWDNLLYSQEKSVFKD